MSLWIATPDGIIIGFFIVGITVPTIVNTKFRYGLHVITTPMLQYFVY